MSLISLGVEHESLMDMKCSVHDVDGMDSNPFGSNLGCVISLSNSNLNQNYSSALVNQRVKNILNNVWASTYPLLYFIA